MTKKFETDVPYIYGGSVNKENVEEILKLTDGIILGKISTNINEIKEIISIIKNI